MTTLEYERETCGRCGGSGRYSYNQIDRDRCYGCGGTGQRLTKRGRAAREFASGLLTVTAGEVKVGDRVRYDDALTGRRITITVDHIEHRQSGSIITNGIERPLIITHLTGKGGAEIAVDSGIRLRRAPTGAEIERIRAYQDSLTKAGKPRKRRAIGAGLIYRLSDMIRDRDTSDAKGDRASQVNALVPVDLIEGMMDADHPTSKIVGMRAKPISAAALRAAGEVSLAMQASGSSTRRIT